ncbi:hypothetical protein ACLBWT_18965 [Paenibacillus sp. D51F]
MKKETELKMLKFLSTYHYRFFQIVFTALSVIGASGIVLPDMNGSRMSALILFVGGFAAVVIFQFLIMSKYESIEKDFKSKTQLTR